MSDAFDEATDGDKQAVHTYRVGTSRGARALMSLYKPKL